MYILYPLIFVKKILNLAHLLHLLFSIYSEADNSQTTACGRSSI